MCYNLLTGSRQSQVHTKEDNFMDDFEMPNDIMEEMTQVFSIERENIIIGSAHGYFCGNENPSTIQLVENTDIKNGDWLIDSITKQRYYAEDVYPMIVNKKPHDWMIKYQTEEAHKQSKMLVHQSTFNIHSITGNSVIGNQENVVLNIGNSLNDIAQLIEQLPLHDQSEAHDLLKELENTEKSNHPILVEGALSKFSNLLNRHSDLFTAVGRWAVQLLIGK